MSALVLRWRRPAPVIVTRWRGPGRARAVVQAVGPGPVATVIGPPGPPGPGADLGTAVIDGGTFF